MDKENSYQSKKLIPVYLQELFLEKTDKTHFVRMPDILFFLEEKDIYAERRTIYSAITLLNMAGFEIIGVQEKGGYKYHHPTRQFDTNELKFLIDSVASSKFLTERKSKELINKIKVLGSIYDKEHLNRNILLGTRIKSMNDKVLKNLDFIYYAINNNSKITFQYVRWNWQKKTEYHQNGELYNTSPYAVSLSDDNYYLIAFDSKSQELRHYRIDKMKSIKLLYECREGIEIYKNFNISEYYKKTFGMFGGREEYVKLICKNSLANVLIDRFGDDVSIRPDYDNPGCFIAAITVNVSPQFYAWIFGLGTGVKIIYPDTIVSEFIEYSKAVLKQYS